eukprot:GEZU01042115.1.p1 GENE.GEZU01042115.1~~GEZU01042115.1.p1  ORF type:complete len:393 (+),score=190.22 GEZU01042115.1:35-1213(+)
MATLPETFAKKDDSRIPVSVITGFLGAGKTTLLNYILTAQHGKRIAVIENEYGEVGIDDGLVLQTDEEIFEMNNGCICCTVRGDLIRILSNLGKRRSKFDMVLIETTGLADPGPIIQTFYMDEEIASIFALDAIITLVDLKHILLHLDEKKEKGVTNEAVEQIAFADRIILNKRDLVTPEHVAEVKRRIREINAFCTMYETEKSHIDLDKILGVGAFNLDRVLKDDPYFLEQAEAHHKHHAHDHDHDHEHCGDECHKEECAPDCTKDHEHHHHHKKPKKEKDDEHHHHKKHQHDNEVSSFGMTVDEPLDYQKTNQFLRKLLQEKGADIYRMKGIINFKNEDKKFVFQGVHMIMDASPGEAWKADEKRITKIVFIGKKLDKEGLRQSILDCRA